MTSKIETESVLQLRRVLDTTGFIQSSPEASPPTALTSVHRARSSPTLPPNEYRQRLGAHHLESHPTLSGIAFA